FGNEIFIDRVLKARLYVRADLAHCRFAEPVLRQFVQQQLQRRQRHFAHSLASKLRKHVFREEALQILFGLLRPLTSLHGAKCFPQLSECDNRFALFRELPRVLGDVPSEILEYFMLRLRGRAEGLLFLAAQTPAARRSLPDMEITDPNSSF